MRHYGPGSPTSPHSSQTNTRSDKDSLDFTALQSEQVLLDGHCDGDCRPSVRERCFDGGADSAIAVSAQDGAGW